MRKYGSWLVVFLAMGLLVGCQSGKKIGRITEAVMMQVEVRGFFGLVVTDRYAAEFYTIETENGKRYYGGIKLMDDIPEEARPYLGDRVEVVLDRSVIGEGRITEKDADGNISFVERKWYGIKSYKILTPFLGIAYKFIPLLAEEDGCMIGGVQILRIIPSGPADKAGFMVGDFILRVNSERIVEEEDFKKIFTKYNPGDEVALKILRVADEEKTHETIRVILEER